MDDSYFPFDERLYSAYVNTTYRTYNPPFSIRIGQLHSALDEWLLRQQTDCWAFITACNPGSVLFPERDNKKRQETLKNSLTGKSYRFIEGAGEGDEGDWPPEPSVLILGIPKKMAVLFAQQYGQNAIVYGKVGEAAELVGVPPL